MAQRFHFRPCMPRVWTGRYGRIPGDSSVYHVRMNNGGKWWVEVEWQLGDTTVSPQAMDCGDVGSLVRSVNRIKSASGMGQDGGSFLINEFSQVLVPKHDGSGEVMMVGRSSGVLLFDNPLEGQNATLDLSDDEGLVVGSPWNKPYIGSQYNLKAWDQIYYWRVDKEGGRSEHPPQQDGNLIRALRRVRSDGAVRFIVNEHGIVLTKVPPRGKRQPEERWAPAYVCRINRDLWFGMESP